MRDVDPAVRLAAFIKVHKSVKFCKVCKFVDIKKVTYIISLTTNDQKGANDGKLLNRNENYGSNNFNIRKWVFVFIV